MLQKYTIQDIFTIVDEVIDNDDIDVTTEVAPLATLSPDEVEEPNQEVFDEKKEKGNIQLTQYFIYGTL
jgi:hypothetical protein